ncbi:hypothetical protein HGRIS_002579 [Hohenbuehelia grisea]|uniref:Zn(2)-C6 fungal-type domain-containing protein n=1 Tax=Hohenbuehelia grisea TaxID=104357 RepID=A0ABR3JL12_9AGAR
MHGIPTYRKLTDEERIEFKRLSGKLSCAECTRLKLKCDRQIPCGSCAKRGCESVCPNGTLSFGKGRQMIIANTGQLHQQVKSMGERIQLLEEALSAFQTSVSDEPHPLLHEDLLKIKRHIGKISGTSSSGKSRDLQLSTELEECLGALSLGSQGESRYLGRLAGPEVRIREALFYLY